MMAFGIGQKILNGYLNFISEHKNTFFFCQEINMCILIVLYENTVILGC